jgi:hypothetical protein
MNKVTGIDKNKKADKPCQFCGKTPACPDWTCPRLASVTVDENGWQVEFVATVSFQFVPPDAEKESDA